MESQCARTARTPILINLLSMVTEISVNCNHIHAKNKLQCMIFSSHGDEYASLAQHLCGGHSPSAL